MKTKAAFVGFGPKVHIGIVQEDGTMRQVLCGAEFTRSQVNRNARVRETAQEVDCKRCAKSASKMVITLLEDHAKLTPEAEAELQRLKDNPPKIET